MPVDQDVRAELPGRIAVDASAGFGGVDPRLLPWPSGPR
jgi:hypothetical protein